MVIYCVQQSGAKRVQLSVFMDLRCLMEPRVRYQTEELMLSDRINELKLLPVYSQLANSYTLACLETLTGRTVPQVIRWISALSADIKSQIFYNPVSLWAQIVSPRLIRTSSSFD